jgi:hypothetical protein
MLVGLFSVLGGWCTDLRFRLTLDLYVRGPKYSIANRQKDCLVNYLLVQTEIAVWKTRKHVMQEAGITDPRAVLLGLLWARLASVQYMGGWCTIWRTV